MEIEQELSRGLIKFELLNEQNGQTLRTKERCCEEGLPC